MTPEPSNEYQKLVEAVARAIMLHHDIDPDVFKGMNGGYGHWIDCARAALSALSVSEAAGRVQLKLPHAGDDGWREQLDALLVTSMAAANASRFWSPEKREGAQAMADQIRQFMLNEPQRPLPTPPAGVSDNG